VSALRHELQEFIENHLSQLGHLVDGNKYNLAFTIQRPTGSADKYLKAVSAEWIKQ